MAGIYAITPFSLLDYPGEMACVVWLATCNLRCVYCHNPDIVRGPGKLGDKDLADLLNSRRGLLTGVVLSGGEPTFNRKLASYAATAKGLGFKVKLDTNGTNPAVVRDLIDRKLIDAVALDYKCPPAIAQRVLNTAAFTEAFQETLAYLIEAHRDGKVHLEIRTTFHTDFMDETDIAWIMEDLERRNYTGGYFLQNIVATGDATLGNIPKPARALVPERLPQPKNFTLGFRNFPTPPAKGPQNPES